MRGEPRAVLVVDDEELVRRFAERALARAGYAVRGASDAEEALAALADPAADFALLLTDLWLEKVSGPDLATLAARERPGLAVLYMTGDPSLFEPDSRRAAGVLGKPFSEKDLLAAVRLALDGDSRNPAAR